MVGERVGGSYPGSGLERPPLCMDRSDAIFVDRAGELNKALGAGGALETVSTLLALEHGVVPGNRNLDNPDPACQVTLVGREPAPLVRPLALKNSFGFGGHNAVLVLGPGPK